MKALFFLLAASLLIFGLFKVITSKHNAYSPLDSYVNAVVKNQADSLKAVNEAHAFLDSLNNKK